MGQHKAQSSFATFTEEEKTFMSQLLTDIKTKLADVETNIESFNVLNKAAEDAVAMKESARVALWKLLADNIAALTEVQASLGPAPVAPPVARPASPTPQAV